jgi:hypothetical protein
MINSKYTSDFHSNTEVAREAEEITIDLLHQLIQGVGFTSVHDDPSCFHLGDILASNGKYYDVKDDGVVHRTGNIFAEEKKFWYRSQKFGDGWMRDGKYDYLCVLDMIDNNLYVLDFNKFKKIYKKGRYIDTNMGDNRTYGYCVPLWLCRESGALLYETPYYFDESWECYFIGEKDEEEQQ